MLAQAKKKKKDLKHVGLGKKKEKRPEACWLSQKKRKKT